MSSNELPADPARIDDLVVEIDLGHPPAAVWRALTTDIGAWWPDAFYSGGEPGKRTFGLEAAPGGRMLESWEGGGGACWGQVLSLTPGASLEVVGFQSPAWGGPGMWIGTWTFEETEDGTRLRFREAAIGRGGDAYCDDKTKGWTFLWDAALRAHLDGTAPPAWID